MRCEEKLGAGLPPLGELGLGLALDLQVSPCTVYINQSGFVLFQGLSHPPVQNLAVGVLFIPCS